MAGTSPAMTGTKQFCSLRLEQLSSKRRRTDAVDEFGGVVAQRRGLLIEVGGGREDLIGPLPRAARQFADFVDAGRGARGEAGGAVDALRITQNQIVDGFQRPSYLAECGF